MDTKDIIENLKALRGEGVRMYAVAYAAGLSQSMLSRYLAGKRKLSAKTAEKLRAYLNSHPVIKKED